MNALNTAVSQSLMTRLLANIFAFLLLLAALAVVVYDILTGQLINQLAYNILFMGAGYALHLLGVNQGVTLTPVSNTATMLATPDIQPHVVAPVDEQITTKIMKVDGTSNA